MVDFFKFIKVFIRSLYLTIKNGSGDIKYKDGRTLQYRTEYIIKIISLLIIKDILKNLRKTKKNYFLTKKEESIKNYIIWRIHLLNYEFVHFSVILDYHFQNISLREFKKKSSINILRKKLNLLKFFSIIYLTFATAFNNLIDIKSRFKKKYSLNIFSDKNNYKGQKFGLMLSSIISKSPRNDLSLYDQLEKLGTSHKDQFIFDGELYLKKILFLIILRLYHLFIAKINNFFFAKLNIYLIKNFLLESLNFGYLIF